LKKPSQKSLPPSLFQREESFGGIRWRIPFFLFWKWEAKKEFNRAREKLLLLRLPRSPPLNFFTASKG
jgi:hypothetical protein